jgi:RHS repeat-associated protein
MRYRAAWGYITDPSGLQQLGARFYFPELGRFVQQDPIGDGMNWACRTWAAGRTSDRTTFRLLPFLLRAYPNGHSSGTLEKASNLGVLKKAL